MKETQFYCLKCRKRYIAKASDIEFETDKRGRPRLVGWCKCGTLSYKYVPYSEESKLKKKYK